MLLCALAANVSSALPAQADRGMRARPWSSEVHQDVAAHLESPELRVLRQAEEELFGGVESAQPEAYDPDRIYGVPDAMSSHAPTTRRGRPQGTIDLSFLYELRLPSLPIRWDSRVIDYLLFFKDDKRGRELMGAWLKRMERYGPMIRRVLGEHALPQHLQFVAMIESGYDPQASSHAGARGMWQFVKAAGSHYGLRIDHWTDERLDPEASTRAAARYLRDLFGHFGSWELAFAAYNMGYGALLRSIRKYNTNDYWLLSHLEAGLPYETSLYVAKIMAAALVATNPERFGFDDLTLEPPILLSKVDVPAGTPLSAVASAAGVDRQVIEKLNAHLLRRRVSPGESPTNVYVPGEQYPHFAQRWSKSKQPAQRVNYVVRFGETFEDVARRFGISVARLREINGLASSAQVGPGFPLLVPAVAEIPAASEPPTMTTVPPRTFHYDGRRRIFYRVTSRDTPESVARFFDVTVDEVLGWNQLAEGANLQRNMLVQLFVREDLDLGRAVVLSPDQVQILTAGSEAFFDFHEAQRGRVRVRYRVQRGDTIVKIADKFDLSASSIGRINQFASNKELALDSWIVVYVPETQVPSLEKKGLIARISPPARAHTTPRKGVPEPEPANDDALFAPPELAQDEPSPAEESSVESDR